MSGYRLLPAADRHAQAWKNGGGVTREVIAHPPGAGMEDFLWRVSIADVEREGDFSLFPEVDRVIAIVAGKLELRVAAQDRLLDPAGPPLAFPGDVPAFGRPVGGTVRDVNLMVRRGQAQGAMQRLSGLSLTTAAQTTILLTQADLMLTIDGAPIPLAPLDAVMLPPGHRLEAEGRLLLLTIDTQGTP